MPRKNVRISNELDTKVLEYCKRNGLTYTTAIMLGLSLLLGSEQSHEKNS